MLKLLILVVLMMAIKAEENIRCGVTDENDAVFTDWYGDYNMASITGVGALESAEACLAEAET